MAHRPVNVDPRKKTMGCTCGWKSKESHASLDGTWDEYDDHTME